MIGPGILLAAIAAQPAGCADHWIIIPEHESFISNGAGKAYSDDDIYEFWPKLAVGLRRTVSKACKAGAFPSASAEKVKIVRVHSASGATEPHFYSEGDRKLHLEWIFAEENLEMPPDAAIIAGLRCWADPKSPGCSSAGD